MLGDNKRVFRQFKVSAFNDYRERVERLAREKSKTVFDNGNGRYAAFVIKNLISNAEHSVRVISATLHLYGNDAIVSAARNLLEKRKSNNIRVILTNPELDQLQNSPFVHLSMEFPEQMIFKRAVKEIHHHLVLMDNVGYRYCTDKKNDAAEVSFNAPEIAGHLAGQFDHIFQVSIDAQIPIPSAADVSPLERRL